MPTARDASFDLDGRVAIVTGASSGLGAAVARLLGLYGARVGLVARREERIAALAQEIGGAAVVCDLVDSNAVAEVVPQVADRLGPPQILVNAAGSFERAHPGESEPLDVVRHTIDLHLIAPFLLSQAVFPHMIEVGRGSIIHISSIGGRVGISGIPQASYAASKAGLSGLTVELAVQWGSHGIRVNTIAPGFFRSEITADTYDHDEQGAGWLRKNTPLPYDGQPEDIAGAVLWLASDAGRYVTGQTIVVDGGWTAR